MRQEVPMFHHPISSTEFLHLIADCFQSVIFGTVDQEGNPHTNVADIELSTDQGLIFATTYQKAFYQRLINHPQISITALRGTETMNSVGITLDGIAHPANQQWLNRIFETHPEMKRISGENRSERRELLRPFAIQPLNGSIYDLRQSPIFQQQLQF